VRTTTNEPDTKSNPNPDPNSNSKQHAIVNIQLNIVACPTYPEKFLIDMLSFYPYCAIQIHSTKH